jgi:rhamnogalacturonan acetylesterase
MNKGLNRKIFVFALLSFISFSSFFLLADKPVFYIIGDSTVRNGDGTGKGSLWGWGSYMAGYFDTTRITVRNDAIGGRSSRTFINEGRWDKIMETLKKGDYVIMQFGHNDSGPLDDTARARGVIRGIGDESKEIYNPITKKQEVVHTYGWYMRRFIQDAKSKGAIPIVCSPIPRDNWKEGKVSRSADGFGGWAKELAKQENACFIDLNSLIADRYDAMGQEAVKAYFPTDHTHTNSEGAKLNASIVAQQLLEQNPGAIKKYLTPGH